MKSRLKAFCGFIGLLGLGGMADAIMGEGSYMVAAVVFAVGFGITLYNYVYGGHRG